MDLRSGDSDLASFGEKILKVVEQLKLVDWKAIHEEKFCITPLGLFDELVRIAEALINRQAVEAERRLLRLAEIPQNTRASTSCDGLDDEEEDEEDEEEGKEERMDSRSDPSDKFGLNLDEF